MPDLPAPHHSAALNAMCGLPPVHPDAEPSPADQAWTAREDRRLARRRRGAARARARRNATAATTSQESTR